MTNLQRSTESDIAREYSVCLLLAILGQRVCRTSYSAFLLQLRSLSRIEICRTLGQMKKCGNNKYGTSPRTTIVQVISFTKDTYKELRGTSDY